MTVRLLGADPAATAVTGVAQPTPAPAPGPDRGEEFGKSSPIALVVILLLGLAVVLLVRSMNKHLRKVPESFEEPDDQPGPGRKATGKAGPGEDAEGEPN